MYNLSLNEKQRTYLLTALKIYQEELVSIRNSVLSDYLKRGFQDDATAVENLVYIVNQTQDEQMSESALIAGAKVFLLRDDKIGAIKFVRANTGRGLKEAKDFVDNMQ